MTLSDIIARLESGESGREIDGDIAWAVQAYPPGTARMMGRKDAACWGFGPHVQWRAPKWSTSLDAAVSLVPEGFLWSANTHCDGADAAVYSEAVAADALNCPTPALALCIAALKARQAKT